MKFIFIAIFISSSLSVASPVERIQAAHPNASPYEVLKMLYEESSTAAQFSDFDIFKSSSAIRCAKASKDWNYIREGVALKKYNYVYEKGQPAHGPLFPEATDKTRTILLAEALEVGTDSQVRAIAARIIMIQTPTDLIALTPSFPFDDPKKVMPIKDFSRVNENLVISKTVIRFGTPKEREFYTYCWKQ
ncbi:MAG: hypothetical protein V4596_12625 [Bdellovibrionota bacterium]